MTDDFKNIIMGNGGKSSGIAQVVVFENKTLTPDNTFPEKIVVRFYVNPILKINGELLKAVEKKLFRAFVDFQKALTFTK